MKQPQMMARVMRTGAAPTTPGQNLGEVRQDVDGVWYIWGEGGWRRAAYPAVQGQTIVPSFSRNRVPLRVMTPTVSPQVSVNPPPQRITVPPFGSRTVSMRWSGGSFTVSFPPGLKMSNATSGYGRALLSAPTFGSPRGVVSFPNPRAPAVYHIIAPGSIAPRDPALFQFTFSNPTRLAISGLVKLAVEPHPFYAAFAGYYNP